MEGMTITAGFEAASAPGFAAQDVPTGNVTAGSI
jgi:hypothetical protein